MNCINCGHDKHWKGLTGDMKPNFCMARLADNTKCPCEVCPRCGKYEYNSACEECAAEL